MGDGDRTTQDHTTLLTLTQNPADRLWRYPLCRAVVGPFISSRLTPMHVTLTHIVAGVSAAALVVVGTPAALLGAGVLSELRAILDCFDGVLARAQKTSSLRGRAMDQLGDVISFVAIIAACCWQLAKRTNPLVAVAVGLVTLAVSASSTACWDIYRRRYASLLAHGRDEVEDEFVELMRKLRTEGGFTLWASSLLARYQLAVFHPTASKDLAVRVELDVDPIDSHGEKTSVLAMKLRAMASGGDKRLSEALRVVGFTGADSVNVIVGAAVFLGYPVEGMFVGVFYAVVSTALATVVSNKILSSTSAL